MSYKLSNYQGATFTALGWVYSINNLQSSSSKIIIIGTILISMFSESGISGCGQRIKLMSIGGYVLDYDNLWENVF